MDSMSEDTNIQRTRGRIWSHKVLLFCYSFKGNSVSEVFDGNIEAFLRGKKNYFSSPIKDVFSDSPGVELTVHAFLLNRKYWYCHHSW